MHIFHTLYLYVFIGVCCIKIVKSGLLILLLRIFERWERYEGRVRVKVCSFVLVTLQHICSTSKWNWCVVEWIGELTIIVLGKCVPLHACRHIREWRLALVIYPAVDMCWIVLEHVLAQVTKDQFFS
jgi:hypothetical protein